MCLCVLGVVPAIQSGSLTDSIEVGESLEEVRKWVLASLEKGQHKALEMRSGLVCSRNTKKARVDLHDTYGRRPACVVLLCQVRWGLTTSASGSFPDSLLPPSLRFSGPSLALLPGCWPTTSKQQQSAKGRVNALLRTTESFFCHPHPITCPAKCRIDKKQNLFYFQVGSSKQVDHITETCILLTKPSKSFSNGKKSWHYVCLW